MIKKFFGAFGMMTALLVITPALSFATDTSLSDLQAKAEQGSAKAQTDLGIIYAGCYGVPCDAHEALNWFKKAAAQGNAQAEYEIGNLYVSPVLLMHPGSSMPQDDKEAVKWWHKSAEQGYIPAQNKLGRVYESGLAFADFTGKYRRERDTVRADYPEALKWYRKAAAQGDTASQAALGDMYAKGEGVSQDFVQAYVWYSRSASISTARAHALLDKMTPAQIAEADRLTKGWKPAPVVLTQKPGVPAGLLASPFMRRALLKAPVPPPVIRTTWQIAVSRAGVGDVMPDGTIYLGKFRSVRWFAMDKDAGGTMNFDQAQQYAKNLKAHGHSDWTIPDQDILEQMFGNRHKGAFNGSYDERGNFSSGWYWSSTQNPKFVDNRLAQWFSSGNSGWIPKDNAFSIRAVRAVAQ